MGHFINGEYLAYNVNAKKSETDELKNEQALYSLLYTKTISASDEKLPHYVANAGLMDFQLKIGGAQMKFNVKDVRIWNKLRDPAEVYSSRFIQANLKDPDLVVNIKLMDNKIEAYIKNEIYKMPVVGVYFEDADGGNIVCPHNRYFDHRSGSCASYPFDDMAIVYTTEFMPPPIAKELGLKNPRVINLSQKYLKSALTLPSEKYTPKFYNKWWTDDNDVLLKQLKNQEYG